jgi:predicted short-subunit dehydrogenase-like oxidoreductase (DUF2520 family)
MDRLAGSTISVVGAGRMGTALSAALRSAGVDVQGPLRRGEKPTGGVVILCVPDREIASAAAIVAPNTLIGHTAGAMTLDVFKGRESFSVHPLMTAGDGRAEFKGASAAISGSSAESLSVAVAIVERLGMKAIIVRDDKRTAYHAAASVAANYLITLETMAARLAAEAGVERADLLPLARAALENWGRIGSAALTGPVARGDAEVVARHREVVARLTPELLAAWDALTDATATLAAKK